MNYTRRVSHNWADPDLPGESTPPPSVRRMHHLTPSRIHQHDQPTTSNTQWN